MLSFAINAVSVVIATIAVIIVGSVWYGPLFGKKWQKYAGVTEKEMKSSMTTSMLGMVVGSLIETTALAVLLASTGATTLNSAIMVGVFAWFGFMMYLHAGSFLWEQKPYKYFVLNTLQALVATLVAVVILVMLP